MAIFAPFIAGGRAGGRRARALRLGLVLGIPPLLVMLWVLLVRNQGVSP